MMRLYTAILLLPAWFFSPSSFAAIFEQPVDLLADLYERNQILGVATSNHSSALPYTYLKALLEKLQGDKRLRFVVIERPSDNQEFYKRASVDPFERVMSSNPFISDFSRTFSLCQSKEWAFFIENVIPLLVEINSERKDNPISLVSVDGISSLHAVTWPAHLGESTALDCKLKRTSGIYAQSGTREKDTADNFRHSVLGALRAGEKAIVVYQYTHLMRTFRTCQPFMIEKDHWETRIAASSWLELLPKSTREKNAGTAVVLIDELDSRYNPTGVLKASNRFRASLKSDMGVRSQNLPNPAASEEGLDAFEPAAYWSRLFEGQHFGSATIDKVFDAVIVSHSPPEANLIKTMAPNIRSYCD